MVRFKGKGLVLRGVLITPHNGSRVQRLAVGELRSRAGNLFTFVEKHKAHPGAVWEGSREICFLLREFLAMRDQTGKTSGFKLNRSFILPPWHVGVGRPPLT